MQFKFPLRLVLVSVIKAIGHLFACTVKAFNHGITISLLIISFYACKSTTSSEEQTLFELLPSSHTGIDFRNDLVYDEKFNPYTFRNFYNGAGVALGDINNDGLVDIFFAGNQAENKLYLNKGNFQFEDITAQAGLAVPGIWSTGVSMADVNGDGLLDIYICKSGPLGGEERHNALYINNGDLTFIEMAHEYGLADTGLSQHAVFFDFDLDGDLDMYLLNNSARSVGINDLRIGQRDIRDPEGGNKLYRNDGGYFVDVSEKAGIYGSAIGYGLGVTVADLNRDGWPDLYVSNDFFEKDYLYLNNGDGTFTEALEDMMTEISMGSMGADIADLNNDGWQDIFVTEMLPATWDRVKTKTPFEDWDKYQANVKAGYFHQFTRNTLQRNLGFKPNSKEIHFAEVSRFAGVHATDWSWGALIFDADNDGLKDIFVANGIVKDLTDFDYVDYYVNNQNLISQYKRDSILLTKMIDEFPSNPLRNYLFKNLGDYRFEDIAANSGLDQLTFSTGAAYADLDNDGDLDLVINNLNGEAFILKNNARELTDHSFIQLNLGGYFGTQVSVYAGKELYYAEHNPVKGYMSSVDHRLHLGLGTHTSIDSIIVRWPSRQETILRDVAVNQILDLLPSAAQNAYTSSKPIQVVPLLRLSPQQIDWKHEESDFVDFDRDRLRMKMISNEGPKAVVADFNGDGLDDVFLPGAKGQSSQIWIQQKNGSFFLSQSFDEDAIPEDIDGLVLDANGDGFPDLYVLSGSLEFSLKNPNYQDRLYLNDGKGKFSKQEKSLPIRYESSSKAIRLDINDDGLDDILVATRTIPFAYGVPVGLSLLVNKGDGTFADETSVRMPDIASIGMARDLWWGDFLGNGRKQLVVVGHWIPISVYEWDGQTLENISKSLGLGDLNGFYNHVLVEDLDGDGKLDLFVGNFGKNSRFLAGPTTPLRMYVNDFDQNGSVEQIITQFENEFAYPIVLKQALLKQLPSWKKQLLNFDSYKDKRLEELVSQEILGRSVVWEVHELASQLFIQQENGTFVQTKLPSELQYAPIFHGQLVSAPNQKKYMVLGGNHSRIKPEWGIQMGSYGWLMERDATSWKIIDASNSGIYIPGEIRSIQQINTHIGTKLLVTRSNERPLIYEWSK
ncbi:VCBS repeat-containing protein [Mongoliitalea daihaiensis]|nr:VCBS repeat-containing protein [Mongoliitalea daihaiensis]